MYPKISNYGVLKTFFQGRLAKLEFKKKKSQLFQTENRGFIKKKLINKKNFHDLPISNLRVLKKNFLNIAHQKAFQGTQN